MPRREAKHIRRELTDAQRERVAEARSLIQGEAAEIRRQAKQYKFASAPRISRSSRTE